MTAEEKPIKHWKQMGAQLDIHWTTAKRLLESHVFYIGKAPAIYPSTLRKLAESGLLHLK